MVAPTATGQPFGAERARLGETLSRVTHLLDARLACYVPSGDAAATWSAPAAPTDSLAIESLARQWGPIAAQAPARTVHVSSGGGERVDLVALERGPGQPLGTMLVVGRRPYDSSTADSDDPRLALLAALLPAIVDTAAELDPRSQLIAWASAQPGGRTAFAVGLDALTEIDQTYGGEPVEAILAELGRRVRSWAGPHSGLARVGTGGHAGYLVVRTDIDDESVARRHATALSATIAAPIVVSIDDQTLHVSRTPRIGLGVDGSGRVPAEELLARAVSAQAGARGSGEPAIVTAADADLDERQRRVLLGMSLADGLTAQQLRLHYQPEFDLTDRRTVAAEALLRWEHPRFGLLGAEQFVPGSEVSPAFGAVQSWVITQACRQLAQWDRQGVGAGLTMRINIAAGRFLTDDAADAVRTALADHDLSGERICVEITERAIPDDPATLERLAAQLQACRDIGVQIAIDDFGTGQGTIAHLLQLPLDVIKLDRAYVHGLDSDRGAQRLVAAVLAAARDFDLDVVAEGIDSPATAEALRELGCTRGQGNWLAPAMAPEQFANRLAVNTA